MKTKKFDCVEMQRKIRDKLWEEAGGDIKKLNEIINKEIENSELYKFLKEKREKSKVLEVI